MNINIYNTTDYENKCNWTLGENKPNSNPNKPNFQKAKMSVNSIITKDYRKKDDFEVRINKPNLVRRRRIAKMNVNAFLQKNYDNVTAFRLQKNKPNSNPILSAVGGLQMNLKSLSIGAVLGTPPQGVPYGTYGGLLTDLKILVTVQSRHR